MLKILKTNVDGHTGHISVTAHVVEQVGENSFVNGAAETHGIAAQALQQQHGGNIKAWLRIRHREMLQRHADRKIATKALEDLQGLTVFEDEETTDGTKTEVERTGLDGTHSYAIANHQPS